MGIAYNILLGCLKARDDSKGPDTDKTIILKWILVQLRTRTGGMLL
jgi:hypothetical protein